jgi:hypothetical protein
MAHGDGPDDLYDDGWDPYDDVDPGDEVDPGDDVDDGEPEDDGGWGEDPPARAAALRLLVGVAVLLLGIGLIVALSKASDDDEDDDRVAAEESTTSSTRRSSTTDLALPGRGSTVTTGGSGSTSSTSRGSSTTGKSTTSTTRDDELPEPGCASGGGGPATAPADSWATRWQTKPQPNDPAKVTICVDDVTPKVGQVVHLSLRGDDPDAVIPNEQCSWFVTWDGPHDNPCQSVTVPTGGPAPTPDQVPGHVVVQLEHTYDTPGAKTIIGSVASTDGDLGPYTSYAEADLVIQVHA